MATKQLSTRVQQKIDTSANWEKAVNFIPLAGEIIVYSDVNKIKIGDGSTTVSNLDFVADGNGTVYEFNTAYDASTNKAATMADIDDAIDTIAQAITGGAW